MPIGVNLTLAWRLKPQLHKQNPPARVIRILITALAKASGLGLFSRDFQSPGLKLTPMGNAMPLQMYRTQPLNCYSSRLR
ncbi:hypothetical protein H6F74_15700 [Trichocoleus sp. FACHB-90]|uniref:hypothetical protein n=1 Tax=Cyanophyceae TaxID=3028117 RepID=UPI001682CC64|nr:hypothetical protein [Trichocoleus sp. FACHB-90]MBD1927677.1 hypothetical protein [Trichocoleus sp. FACHB-90]